MKKNTILMTTIGIAASAVALYFALKNVPAAELIRYMGRIDWFWAAVTMGLVILSFVLRAYRWQVILGPDNGVKLWEAYHPLIIGFMLNSILPGRVGEIARPVILRQKSAVPFTTGIATVVAERVFDLLMLMAMFAAVIVSVEIDPGFSIPFGEYHLNKQVLMLIADGILKISIVLIAGIAMVGFRKPREMIKRVIMAAPRLLFFAGKTGRGRVEEKVCTPLNRLVDSFASGFDQVKNIKALLLCLLLSTFIWLLAGLSYYTMSVGCPGIDLSFPKIVAMMVIICFFIALPSVPGFWGIWEAAGVFALLLFGVAKKDAAGYTLANHAVQMLPVILLGLVSAFVTGINIRHLPKQEKRDGMISEKACNTRERH